MTKDTHQLLDELRPATVNVVAHLERCAELIQRAAADRRAAAEERDQVVRASRRTIRRLERYATRLQDEAAHGRAVHINQRLPLIAACQRAFERGETDAALVALDDLARSFGGRLGFRSQREFDELIFVDDPFDLSHVPPRPPPPPAGRLLRRLGTEAPAPIDHISHVATLVDAGDPTEMMEPPGLGAHLAARRRVAGVPYEHHGIALGDGRIIHFTGEPAAVEHARVELTLLDRFIASTERTEIVEYRARSFEGRPVASLRASAVALRALHDVGAGGYSLMSWNCEHFACWAKLGARISVQVAHLRKRVAQLLDLSPAAAEGVAEANRELQAAGTLIFDTVEPSIDFDRKPTDRLILDLARAYWAEDLRRPVVYFPLWDESGDPPAGVDRPWSADGITEDSAWSRNCPSTHLRRDWHASLLWLEDSGFWWLTSDGRWLASAAGDVVDIIERRLAAATDVLVTYLTGSYTASQLTTVIDRLGIIEFAAKKAAKRRSASSPGDEAA